MSVPQAIHHRLLETALAQSRAEKTKRSRGAKPADIFQSTRTQQQRLRQWAFES